jgi:uncharacterized RDD family membrane protein YckC
MAQAHNPTGDEAAGAPGELWPRFFARLIDGLLLGVVGTLLGAAMNYSTAWLILQTLLVFGYFVAMDVTQGTTVGKRLLGMRVVGPDGGLPTGGQAAAREAFTLLGVIPFLGGLLSLIAAIVIAVSINSSPSGQGRHDDLAGGTRVLRT